MLHNNSSLKKKLIRFYLDFDGTLTKIAGELLFKSGVYAAFKQSKSHEQLVSLLKNCSEYGLADGTLEFLKEYLEKNNEIIIISRNDRKYIAAMFEASGLNPALSSKIKIYDAADLSLVDGDKGKIVEKHEQSQPIADEIIVCDDNPTDANSMFSAIIKNTNNIHASCFVCLSGHFDWQQICSQNNEYRDALVLQDSNNWLIRESSSNSSQPFTLVFNFAGSCLKKRHTLIELQYILFKQEFSFLYQQINYVKKLYNPLKPTNVPVPVPVPSLNAPIIITPLSVIGAYLDPQIKPADIIEHMKNNKSPSVAIYRVKENSGQFLSTIEGPKDNTAVSYAISYLTENNTVKTLKFKTKERDPKVINTELCKKLKTPLVVAGGKPKQEVFTELLSQQEPTKKMCGLIHLHRDKTIRPEEQLFVINSINNTTGAFIISTQTPTKEAKNGDCKFATRGGTGCEIERILSKASAPLQDKWIIITGHGNAGDSTVSGGYNSQFFQTQEEITCDEKEYTALLIKSGIKKGDKINLLLYVCESAGSLQQEKSFAEKLATCLAEQGISSNIVASKTGVNRFSGYIPDRGEIPGECLSYNVCGGPQNIVLVTGIPGTPPVIELKEGLFPNGFFITPHGLGAPLVQQPIAKITQSAGPH